MDAGQRMEALQVVANRSQRQMLNGVLLRLCCSPSIREMMQFESNDFFTGVERC